jgi:anaerobic selenocysteine-containing dehydrogenase
MGGSATAVAAAACGVPEKELLVQSSIEMPEDMVTGLDNWYATIDRQNRAPLGIVVRVMEGRAKKVEGNVDYPVNRGKHNAVAEAGLQGLYHPDRIGSPLIRTGQRGEGKWEQLSWTDAVSRVAERLGAASGEETVLITDPVGAHMGLVVNRFAEALGAKHMSYEPLERTVLKASMKQVFDQDAMPDFDIENAAYILSFGADFLNTWESPVRYARGYGHFRQGENRKRGKLVHFDSRFSMTGANADEWVYVKPGYEGEVALAIANVMIAAGVPGSLGQIQFLTRDGSNRLERFTPEAVGSRAGVAPERIIRIARDFLSHPPGLAIGGGSAGAHSNGLFNLNAIYSLNYLSGSVGKEGGIIFNPPPPIRHFPLAPDATPFSDFWDLAGRMSGGQVKALLVRNADPFYGLPENTAIRQASFNVPLIVSFSNSFDDTTMLADIILPENHYLEDWGTDIPNPGPGYQTIGFQQPVVRSFFESRGPHLGTKNFGDVLMTLAQVLEKDLDLDADNFKGLIENDARRLHEMDRGSVRAANDKLFWNTVLQRGGWWDTGARGDLHDPRSAQYSFPTNPQTPSTGGSGDFHLIPFETTGLTDGRGADLPWLQATPDPITTATWRTWVEINMKKAEEMGINEGDVVKVTSEQGSIEALAYPHPGISPDVVAIPVGQGHKGGGRYAKDRGANVLSILSPVTESETGALAWAATRVNVRRTGEWIRLPKFENTAPDLAEDGHRKIIPLTSG